MVAELSQMVEIIAIGCPSAGAWSSAPRALALVPKQVVCTYLIWLWRKVQECQQSFPIQSNSPCRNLKRHSRKTKCLTGWLCFCFPRGKICYAEVWRGKKPSPDHQVTGSTCLQHLPCLGLSRLPRWLGLRLSTIPQYANPCSELPLSLPDSYPLWGSPHREEHRDGREVLSFLTGCHHLCSSVPLDDSQVFRILLEAPGISEPLWSWFDS